MHPWRERLGRWFAPLARRVPVSPNTISVLALLLNLGAAACFACGAQRPALFLGGIVLLAIGGLADALDGIVARVQGKTSRYGDFLDHCLDRVSDSVVAAAWLAGNGVRVWLAMAVVIATMLNGYVGTQIEATWGSRSYEPVGRGEFVLALVVLPIVSYILFTNGWAAMRFASLTIAEWLASVLLVFALLGLVQRMRLAAAMERS